MAARYWVGGTATWDGTAGTKWALTSGGAGGQAVPTASDDVFFSSGSGTGTVTLSNSSICKSLNCTGFTGTLSHPTATVITVVGSLTLSSGMTYTVSTTNATTIKIAFTGTSTGYTITTAGKLMPLLTFNGVSGEWTLQDNFTAKSTSSSWTVTNGSINTNNKTVTVATIANGGAGSTGTITLGSSTIYTSSFRIADQVGITLSASSATIDSTGFTGLTVSGYDKATTVIGTIISKPTSSTSRSFLDFTCNTLNITNTSSTGGNNVYMRDVVINTALTIAGIDSISKYIELEGNGTSIVCNGTVSLSHTLFTSISASGTSAPWSGTYLVDGTNNSGITFTAPRTLYWVGNGGNWDDQAHWALTSGGAGGNHPPLAHDNVILNASSFKIASQKITRSTTYVYPTCKDFTAAAVTNSPTIYTDTITCYGNMTFGNTCYLEDSSGYFYLYLEGDNTEHTFIEAGMTATAGTSIVLSGYGYYGSVFNLGANTVKLTQIDLYDYVVFNSNDYSITVADGLGFYDYSTANFGSSVIAITQPFNSIYAEQDVTINGQSSKITITNTIATSSSDAIAIADSAKVVFNELTLVNDNLVVYGSFSVNKLTINNAGGAVGTKFESAKTVSFNQLVIAGDATHLSKLSATAAGSQFTLRKNSNGNIQVPYIDIKDGKVEAISGAWIKGTGFVDSGNNTGWVTAGTVYQTNNASFLTLL